ncbi:MAG: pyridoxamine 5'-phosphate oxidase [Limnobacter sp.]|nr:pyridoxamine 5'-phosphate oxidase [Limnobacter sp.]
MSIADLRKDYMQGSLHESEALESPFDFFRLWFDQALKAELPEPNAMSLATIGLDGRPASRIVLIKAFDDEGVTFYTNYKSRKGREIEKNPYASILFHWTELERQVRIEGKIKKVSEQQSDEYFHSRPVKSRLGAWASPQSETLPNREALEALFEDAQREQGDAPPRPPHWGGYKLVPDYFEFWQGRRSRLHDRLAYTLRDNGQWELGRLAP